MILPVFIVVFVLILPSPTNGLFFNRCPGTERCGFFGFSIVMRSGQQGTDQCEEFCVFFQDDTLECGACSVGTAQVPTPSPRPITPVNGEYDISLQLIDIPSSDQVAFTRAAQRWESIIVGDLPSVSRTSLKLTGSLYNGCVVPDTIDDLYICAVYADIDGAGRVLGSAGPLDTRGRSLPVTGTMEFDIADISSLKSDGEFESVILHEMGHVLGIGTLWTATGATGPESANCPYLGPKANAEYKDISGCDVVPTENDGAPEDGTFCGHWDEECMGTELMTGFSNSGTNVNPLSRITVASLEDIGYNVNYTNVDTYTKNDISSNCVCNRRRTLRDRDHGETHQLGLRLKPGMERRQLSDEMYNVAITYGKKKLAESKEQMNQFGSLFTDLDQPNNIVANTADPQVISVFVKENGAFFDVVVRGD